MACIHLIMVLYISYTMTQKGVERWIEYQRIN